MLSKGDIIDWDEVENGLSAYMRRTHGTAANELTFWHSQGGLECFFTRIDGKMYKNRFFDTPVTLAEVQARDEPITVKIDWDALFVEYGAHISRRPIDMGKALWLTKFWEDRGGQERYFDTGPFGESVRREYLLAPPGKIDWDSIHADWSDFWRHRGFAQDQLAGYEEFWNRLGGIDLYFDTDDKGIRTQREFKRPN